jgi:hypothetical protein
MSKTVYSGPERRKEKRVTVMPDFIHIFVFSDDVEFENNGIILDMCDHGTCMTYCRPLENNSKIKVLNPVLGNFHRDAVVRWSKKIADDMYKIGLVLF